MRSVDPQRTGTSAPAVADRLATLLEGDDQLTLGSLRSDLVEILHATRLLEDMAERDALTGAYNRRGFNRIIDRSVGRQRQDGSTCSALFVDIDRLKDLNVRHGHVAIDGLLHDAAERLRRSAHPYETLVRWGGDEFVLLLPEVDIEEAAAIAERIRTSVTAEPFVCESRSVDLSVSIGVSEMRDGEPVMELVRRISAEMYEAKSAGRNRISVFHPGPVATGADCAD